MTDASGLGVALVIATTAGGTGRHVRSLASGLANAGGRVAVIGPPSTEDAFHFAQAGVRFIPLEVSDRLRPARDLQAVVRLRGALSVWDVVHAHGVRAGGLAALASIGRRRPRLAVTLHNAAIAGGTVGATYAVLMRIVARRADAVLGVSSDLVEEARRMGARRVDRALAPAPVSPPPRADRAAVRKELGVGERPIVLAVGRLAEQKGLHTLLDAAGRWTGLDGPPILVIAGEGPLQEELSRRIEAERLPVRLLGRRDDVPDLLQAANVAVLPSVWEGQSLVLQEMLRAGRPIVATRVGGIPEMAGDAALLVPVGDASALAHGVSRMIREPDLAARLSDAARRRAAELPTEQQAVDQVIEIYRSF